MTIEWQGVAAVFRYPELMVSSRNAALAALVAAGLVLLAVLSSDRAGGGRAAPSSPPSTTQGSRAADLHDSLPTPASGIGRLPDARVSEVAVEGPADPEQHVSLASHAFSARLVNAEGLPNAGGFLFVRPPLALSGSFFGADDAGRLLMVSLPLGAARPRGTTAESDSDGRVLLELGPGDAALAQGGWLELRAEGPGLAAALVRAELPAPGAVRELGEIVLLPGRALRGTVILSPGTDPARARVLLARSQDPAYEVAPADRSLYGPVNQAVLDQAPLGPAGAFELSGVTTEACTVWAFVPSAGFAWADIEEGSTDRHGIVLAPAPLTGACAVEGRVLAPDETPAGEAFVHVLYPGEERARTTVRSDYAGFFRIPLRSADSFTLVALDSAFLHGEARAEARPCDRDVQLRLPGRATLRVSVQDSRGARLAGSSVEVLDRAGKTPWHYGHTEVEPGVHGVALPPAPFGLRVAASGHKAVLLVLDPAVLGPEVVCTLELDAAVTGVVTHGGSPLKGARVVLQRAAPSGYLARSRDVTGRERFFEVTSAGIASETVTDASGHFALSCTREGLHVVRAELEPLGSATSAHLRLTPGAASVQVALELPDAGSIAGCVLMPPGKEAAGIAVGVSRGDGIVRCTRTDSEGRFRLDSLSPGGWQVRRCENNTAAHSAVGPDARFGFVPALLHPGVPTWDCFVESGSTTAFDLDLRDEGGFALVGRTNVLEGGWATLRDLASPNGAPLAVGAIAKDGSFSVALSSPGTFLLVAEDGDTQVTASVVLERGTGTWRYEPSHGQLVLKAAPGASEDARKPLVLVKREPDGTDFRRRVFAGDGETGRRWTVPSGEAAIERAFGLRDSAAGLGHVLATVSVPEEGGVELVVGAPPTEDL